jgi:hypothetical protein
MRRPRRPIGLALALLACGAAAALADDPAPGAGKPGKAAKAAKAPAEDVLWRPQWTEAVEEAAERNLLVMLHSHGST